MSTSSGKWLIMSIKYTRGFEIVWWMANFSGYTTRLEDAGRYTEEEARPRNQYFDGTDQFETVAVPEALIEGRVRSVVPDYYVRDILADLWAGRGY